MELLEILNRVPQLLHTCVANEIAALKRLRLVGKGFSRTALLALKSYTLTLRGNAKDTNVCGARLLRQARLQGLHVSLDLSGSFSPALLLETFVRDVGSALSTVSCLHLHLQGKGNIAVTTIVLNKELSLLMAACSSLTSLTLESYVCPVFLQMVGQVCPLASAINIQIKKPQDLPHMDRIVLQLPSLLPRLSSLGILSAYPIIQLPDMLQSQGILQLDLSHFQFNHGVQWCCLPPKMRYLKCKGVAVGPPAMADGRILLPELQRLQVYCICMPLNAVAQLIRCSPFLESLCSWSDHEICITVSMEFSTGDDMRLLAASDLAFLQDPIYKINCNKRRTFESEVAPFLVSLPIMVRVTRCEIQECYIEDLGPLLSVFPNVRTLSLDFLGKLNDVDLQVVGGCSNLAELELSLCSSVSAMGVFALCLRLPGLGFIRSTLCGQLTDITLDRCQQLLGRGLKFVVTN